VTLYINTSYIIFLMLILSISSVFEVMLSIAVHFLIPRP
jgi:hypothetical protein